MAYGSGLEGRTGWNKTVGAFEVDAITEGHAVQRIDFVGKEEGGRTSENTASLHEIRGVGRVLPKGWLRDIRWQDVEPSGESVALGGKDGEIGPMNIVLIVTGGGFGGVIGDA